MHREHRVPPAAHVGTAACGRRRMRRSESISLLLAGCQQYCLGLVFLLFMLSHLVLAIGWKQGGNIVGGRRFGAWLTAWSKTMTSIPLISRINAPFLIDIMKIITAAKKRVGAPVWTFLKSVLYIVKYQYFESKTRFHPALCQLKTTRCLKLIGQRCKDGEYTHTNTHTQERQKKIMVVVWGAAADQAQSRLRFYPAALGAAGVSGHQGATVIF